MVAWFHDSSNYQRTTPSLDGWDGLIAKASEGSDFKDGRFWQHINVAREAKKAHAGYHFLRSDSPIKDQVENFTSVCPPEIAAVPDVEWIKDERTGRIISAPTLDQTVEFVDRLRQKGYHVPMQYLPRWYWNYWGQPDLAARELPPLWVSYYPDYVARPRDKAWEMIPESAKWGFGGLPVIAVQFTSSPTDQNRTELSPEEFYNFLSTTRRGPGGGGTGAFKKGNDMFFMRVMHENEDGTFGGWVDDKLYMSDGGLVTGGWTEADLKNARADASNGPIPFYGVRNEVFQDLRVKGEIPRMILEALQEMNRKLDSLSVGGVDTVKLTADLAAGLSQTLPGTIVAEFKKEGN